MSAVSALRVRPRSSQYVFAPGKYEDLGDKEHRTIRRNVALFPVHSVFGTSTPQFAIAHDESGIDAAISVSSFDQMN